MNQPTQCPNDEDSRTFWQAYLAWQGGATDAELVQLEESLTHLQTQEVMPVVRAIQLALRDEQSKRALPASLVTRLQEAHWPTAQAIA